MAGMERLKLPRIPATSDAYRAWTEDQRHVSAGLKNIDEHRQDFAAGTQRHSGRLLANNLINLVRVIRVWLQRSGS